MAGLKLKINGIILIHLEKSLNKTGKRLAVYGTTLIKMESCSATPFLMVISLPIVGLWLRALGSNKMVNGTMPKLLDN